MSLKASLSQIADDFADAAAPFAARWTAGLKRIAVAEGETLAIYEIANGETRRLQSPEGRSDRSLQGELRLPAASVLTRTLSFPAASRDYLEPVIANRLERLTPWPPERVVYGFRAEDAADGQLSVELAATSNEIVELWTRRAEAIGFVPTAIGAASEPIERPLAIDLWRGRADPLRAKVRRTLLVAAAAAFAVTLPLCGWSFYALSASEQRLAAVGSRADAARATIRRMAGGDAQETRLMGAKSPETAVMTMIDRLAMALPDGTVLRELDIEPARIRLAGSSKAAPELIGLLEQSGVMTGPRFAAPVTRSPDGRDGFEILASRPGAPAEPAP